LYSSSDIIRVKKKEDGEIKIYIILFVGIHHFRGVGTDGRIILKSLVLVNVAMIMSFQNMGNLLTRPSTINLS
jgi:hypothetical protein